MATILLIYYSYLGNSVGGTQFRDKMHDMEIEGNVLHQFKTIMNFFTRNLRKIQVEKEFNSLGQLEIPYESLTEYIVNALVHRSLNIKSPIRIFIFDDRVEIHSPGSLPNGLTVEDIKNGTSMPRNTFLFNNTIYLLPYTGAGSGIRRALEFDPNALFSNGTHEREITHSDNEFLITIPRKSNQLTNQESTESNQVTPESNHASSKSKQPNDQVTHKTDQVNDQPIQNTTKLTHKTDQVNDQPIQNTIKPALKTDITNDQPIQNTTKLKLSKKQQDIRNYCSVPRTGKEILQRAGVTDHFDSRKRYIYDLVEAGILERTIPDTPNDPNQKYRRKQ